MQLLTILITCKTQPAPLFLNIFFKTFYFKLKYTIFVHDLFMSSILKISSHNTLFIIYKNNNLNFLSKASFLLQPLKKNYLSSYLDFLVLLRVDGNNKILWYPSRLLVLVDSFGPTTTVDGDDTDQLTAWQFQFTIVLWLEVEQCNVWLSWWTKHNIS